jgi:gliding motility-associated-like protein
MPEFKPVIKWLFAITSMMIGLALYAQEECQIYPGDTTVCYNSYVPLYTNYADTLNYYWHHSGETSVIVEVQVKDTTTYYLTVTNKDSTWSCTDSVIISIYPRIYVEFEQINKGCPDECKSQVIGSATGGFPPYQYFWNASVAPNDSSLALGLCSESTYTLLVQDTLCLFDTAYEVEGYELPEINLSVSPDTLYLTNPIAELSFENTSDTISLTNWVWIFPDSTTTNDAVATYVFQGSDSVLFVYTTDDGCVDTLSVSAQLKEFEMEIPNVFTPNGDGTNEFWKIPDLEKYISSEVIIFDRWGKKVFEALDYQGDWDGGRLGDGVYFYILKCAGYWKEEIYKGSVTIIGSRY